MKAERRHELQTNSLALWMMDLPDKLRQHGSKILLGCIIVLLAIVLWRHFRTRAEREAASNAADLALAQSVIQQLQQSPASLGGGMTPDKAAAARDRINQVLTKTQDAPFRARAYVLLGNYYWALATYPNPLDSDLRNVDDDTDSAEKAWKTVAESPEFKDQPLQVAQARLGLAAIAENRALAADIKRGNATTGPVNEHWQQARAYYDQVVKDPASPPIAQEQAKWQLEQLARVQTPVVIAPPKPITTAPATRDATLGPPPPATLPATQATPPATRPAPAVVPLPASRPSPVVQPATAP